MFNWCFFVSFISIPKTNLYCVRRLFSQLKANQQRVCITAYGSSPFFFIVIKLTVYRRIIDCLSISIGRYQTRAIARNVVWKRKVNCIETFVDWTWTFRMYWHLMPTFCSTLQYRINQFQKWFILIDFVIYLCYKGK